MRFGIECTGIVIPVGPIRIGAAVVGQFGNLHPATEIAPVLRVGSSRGGFLAEQNLPIRVVGKADRARPPIADAHLGKLARPIIDVAGAEQRV